MKLEKTNLKSTQSIQHPMCSRPSPVHNNFWCFLMSFYTKTLCRAIGRVHFRQLVLSSTFIMYFLALITQGKDKS